MILVSYCPFTIKFLCSVTVALLRHMLSYGMCWHKCLHEEHVILTTLRVRPAVISSSRGQRDSVMPRRLLQWHSARPFSPQLDVLVLADSRDAVTTAPPRNSWGSRRQSVTLGTLGSSTREIVHCRCLGGTLVLLQRTQKFLCLCNVGDLRRSCTEESPCRVILLFLHLYTTLSNSHRGSWLLALWLVKLRAYLMPFSSSLPAVFPLRGHWLPEACHSSCYRISQWCWWKLISQHDKQQRVAGWIRTRAAAKQWHEVIHSSAKKILNLKHISHVC